MRTFINKYGKEEILFLSRTDRDILIYMNTDIWITPELKKFKNGILERLEKTDPAD